MSKQKNCNLHAFFDTSIIHNEKSASNLFNKKTSAAIQTESYQPNINIFWYLPEVVIKERQYQMQKSAKALAESSSIKELEKFIGNNFNITHEVLEGKVDEYINMDVKNHNIKILKLDESIVDWKNIIDNACFRRLPFSRKEKEIEKGFRDSIIAETFFQFIENLSKTEENKVVFFANDSDLLDYVIGKVGNIDNITFLRNIEDLTGLIAFQFDEKLIKEYQDLSESYFFDKEKRAGLFYEKEIKKTINNEYQSILKLTPPGSSLKRKNTNWKIFEPHVLERKKTHLTWKSTIEISFDIYKDEVHFSASLFDPATFQGLFSAPVLPEYVKFDAQTGKLNVTNHAFKKPFSYVESDIACYKGAESSPLTLSPSSITKTIFQGKTVFSVVWSVIIDFNKNFSSPTIDKINYEDTVWGNITTTVGIF